jgi:hypothetical protein
VETKQHRRKVLSAKLFVSDKRLQEQRSQSQQTDLGFILAKDGSVS